MHTNDTPGRLVSCKRCTLWCRCCAHVPNSKEDVFHQEVLCGCDPWAEPLHYDTRERGYTAICVGKDCRRLLCSVCTVPTYLPHCGFEPQPLCVSCSAAQPKPFQLSLCWPERGETVDSLLVYYAVAAYLASMTRNARSLEEIATHTTDYGNAAFVPGGAYVMSKGAMMWQSSEYEVDGGVSEVGKREKALLLQRGAGMTAREVGAQRLAGVLLGMTWGAGVDEVHGRVLAGRRRLLPFACCHPRSKNSSPSFLNTRTTVTTRRASENVVPPGTSPRCCSECEHLFSLPNNAFTSSLLVLDIHILHTKHVPTSAAAIILQSRVREEALSAEVPVNVTTETVKVFHCPNPACFSSHTFPVAKTLAAQAKQKLGYGRPCPSCSNMVGGFTTGIGGGEEGAVCVGAHILQRVATPQLGVAISGWASCDIAIAERGGRPGSVDAFFVQLHAAFEHYKQRRRIAIQGHSDACNGSCEGFCNGAEDAEK